MLMQIVAWCASILVFLAFFMRTMIPLRYVAIASNLVFITYTLFGLYYGIFWSVFPIFVLHISLLPLNYLRLRQMKKLIKDVNDATSNASEQTSVDYLIPYMNKVKHARGDVLFNKGDQADSLYFLQDGEIELPELEKTLGAGAVFGEVGVFLPKSIRSAGAVCSTDCELYRIHRERVLELYYQNPKFGFFIVNMLANYTADNVNKLMQLDRKYHELADQKEALKPA